MDDPQITFWATVGLVGIVGLAFFAVFWLWPSGGDPRKGGDHYPPTTPSH